MKTPTITTQHLDELLAKQAFVSIPPKTVIIMEVSIKMAKYAATKTYGLGNWEFVAPYRYASKGNNFYEFKIFSYPQY